jgi:hypothetical protein
MIERPDYEVRVIPPVGPPGLLHVRVKAGLAHHHGEERVLMVPLEVETQNEVAEATAAAAVGFYRSTYACPKWSSASPSRCSPNSSLTNEKPGTRTLNPPRVGVSRRPPA